MKPSTAAPSVLVALLACMVTGASAAPAPVLGANLPAYVQAGQTRELTLGGQNLAGATSLAVANPRGLAVELIKPAQANDGQVKLKVTATAAAEPGDRELRVVSAGGVSNPFIVSVGPFPLVETKEPNATPDQAQPVQLPAVIVGRIGAGGEADTFSFHATKGQHLLFDASVARLGSALEPVIVVHDPAGREVPTNTEMHGPDPLVVLDVPADGDYRLEVRDLRFRGGSNFDYRIEAGAIPFVDALLPMSAPRGKVVEVQAVGHNLQGGERITLDLTAAQPGRMMVRAKTPLGLSNEVPFDVTGIDSSVGAGANHAAATAAAVPFPADVSGRLEQPGNEDFYKFHLPQKQAVGIEVIAHRIGSPIDTLLSLRNATGGVIDTNNGAGGADARINRELDAGDYLVSVRDLTYAGGPNFAYRLQVHGPSQAGAAADFSVRFLPDAPRLHRGGNAAIWCEVERAASGFAGDVAVSFEGLPNGVTCPPVTIGPATSGIFALAAAPDAALGAFPIRLKATATVNGQPVVRYAEPEFNGRGMQQAYLTVLDAAPFTIEPLTLTPQRVQQFRDEVAALTAKLAAPNANLDAAQAEWEKRIVSAVTWNVLDPLTLTAASGTTLTKQPDGSVLAGGTIPPKDNYTLTAKTNLKGITAVRLEVLAHPSLGGQGPGAAPNGNFVLTEFKVTAQKGGEPAQPVALKNATADFSQEGFPVAGAVDNNAGTGWAVAPQFAKDHVATFLTTAPAGFDGETTLGFVLEHQSVHTQHNIGRFRISVTTADPAALPKDAIPAPILAIVKTPAAQRTPEQRTQLTTYFRANDSQAATDRARLESIKNILAPFEELQKLEQQLAAPTPQLADEQAKWEQSPAAQAANVPPPVQAILKTPAATRTDAQKNELSAYYRTVAPSLQAARDKATLLRSQVNGGSVVTARSRATSLPVVITRAPGFAGEIEVKLQGFSAGRDPGNRLPTPAAKNLKLAPLKVTGEQSFATLTFTPEAGSEVGTRQVVLTGETKVGNDAIVQHSPAFPLTVNEK